MFHDVLFRLFRPVAGPGYSRNTAKQQHSKTPTAAYKAMQPCVYVYVEPGAARPMVGARATSEVQAKQPTDGSAVHRPTCSLGRFD